MQDYKLSRNANQIIYLNIVLAAIARGIDFHGFNLWMI